MALRQDDVARGMVGDLHMLYSTGISLTTEPLLSLLAAPEAGVFDFSLLLVPMWAQETYVPHPSAKNIMAFVTEWDLVDFARLGMHTKALRGSSPTYRSYEVAGAPHVPDTPVMRILTEGLSEGTTPLDWTPVARALFVAGHRWTTEGLEPPPSVSLGEAPEGQPDPVYQDMIPGLVTGIARDENGNALGGIRLPDLAVGRGQ